MWKIFVGFVLFEALALFILQKSGGDVDLGGEKHEVAPASGSAHSAGPDTAPAAKPAASAASAP